MSDESLRLLERRAAEAPDDPTAERALLVARDRAGEPVRSELLARLAGAVERRKTLIEEVLRLRRGLMFLAIYGRQYGRSRAHEVLAGGMRSITGRMTSRDPNLPGILPDVHPSDAAAPPPLSLEDAVAMRARWEAQYRVVGEFREQVERIASAAPPRMDIGIDYRTVEERALRSLYHRPETVYGMRMVNPSYAGEDVRRVLERYERIGQTYGSWMEEVEDQERRAGRVFPEDERRAQADRAYRLDWPEPAPVAPDLPPAEPSPRERAREKTRANVRRPPPRRLR